ncbi:NYN domain-containing protein [Pseudoduganella danionis]|uniref:NYN domain-containing protein n=1 Tax=Pseudoduganella danionis TaxID=1890295 RepID=A0ABW9STU8_9BURK|nr:NYN domain-containing protein [Pseudoduganella danionis]MTW34999.1 NYN domain-containing protein [Pseudoduganella danionis]
MASSNENVSMALFCDFENVALGVRDANYDKFDIKPVLERLLLKGSIVVKKAYCDWDRYKGFKAPMHEANFELIEIPHVRLSGKNSADIRMVVDALDLCYTKSHVDTFVIISGDSDFSPLVSKLRENAKKVIGVGVKQSTSDLLVANCDEFIFYDDLVRESRRAKRDASENRQAVKRTPEEERARREEMDKRRNQAVEIAIDTFEALVLERGDSGKIWASVLKEAIKRRKPDFSESYYGFRTFGNLIEECKARGLLEFGRDEKSGAYVYRGSGVPMPAAVVGEAIANDGVQPAEGEGAKPESRRSRNRGRTAAERFAIRQAERQARAGQVSPGAESAGADDGAAMTPVSQPEAVQVAEVAMVPAAAPVAESLQESAAETAGATAATQAAAPAKKKNGTKPPARKVKAANKQKTEQQGEAKPEAVAESRSDAPAVSKPEAPAAAKAEAALAAKPEAPVVAKPEVPAAAKAEGAGAVSKPAPQQRDGAAKKSPRHKAKPAAKPAASAAPVAQAAAPAAPASAAAAPAAAKVSPAAAAPAGEGAEAKAASPKPARKPAPRKPRPPKAAASAE